MMKPQPHWGILTGLSLVLAALVVALVLSILAGCGGSGYKIVLRGQGDCELRPGGIWGFPCPESDSSSGFCAGEAVIHEGDGKCEVRFCAQNEDDFNAHVFEHELEHCDG